MCIYFRASNVTCCHISAVVTLEWDTSWTDKPRNSPCNDAAKVCTVASSSSPPPCWCCRSSCCCPPESSADRGCSPSHWSHWSRCCSWICWRDCGHQHRPHRTSSWGDSVAWTSPTGLHPCHPPGAWRTHHRVWDISVGTPCLSSPLLAWPRNCTGTERWMNQWMNDNIHRHS